MCPHLRKTDTKEIHMWFTLQFSGESCISHLLSGGRVRRQADGRRNAQIPGGSPWVGWYSAFRDRNNNISMAYRTPKMSINLTLLIRMYTQLTAVLHYDFHAAQYYRPSDLNGTSVGFPHQTYKSSEIELSDRHRREICQGQRFVRLHGSLHKGNAWGNSTFRVSHS